MHHIQRKSMKSAWFNLFGLMILFPFRVVEVTSFCSKPDPCPLCCSEQVLVCSPGAACPAHWRKPGKELAAGPAVDTMGLWGSGGSR